MPERAVTPDTLFQGRLVCHQHEKGYRFSVDSVLAAHFLEPRPGDRVLDLGAGCGVIALILAYRHPEINLSALELQSGLVALLRRNCQENFAGRIAVKAGDLRHIDGIFPAGSFDAVVANPPYYKAGSGRINPDREQAVARHELTATIADVAAAAGHCLGRGGRAVFVYPVARLLDLLTSLRQSGLEPSRMRLVHSYPGGRAATVLVEAVKGGGGGALDVLPPFFIYDAPGGRRYSREMLALYAP